MKINKKIISAVLASGLLITSASAFEMTPIDTVKNAFSLKADGTYLNSESYVFGNALFVPVRDVAEALGAEVKWDNDTRTVEITTGKEKSDKYNGVYTVNAQNVLQLPAYFDSVKIIIDGKEIQGQTFIANDKTYIPFESIEALTSHMYLDPQTYSLRLYSPTFNTDGSFMTYGEKKVNKEDTMDILNFVYQADVAGAAVSERFVSLDNYLLLNDAIVKLAYESGIDMSEKTLEKFYEENPINMLSPVETLKDTDGVKENILKYYYAYKNIGENLGTLYTPTDEELKALYEKTPYYNKLTLKAQHILISKDENGEGLKKIENLLKEAKKKGTDFTKLMLENSEDPGSQSQPDGYVFGEGEMVSSFYETALKTPVGEISDVFESEYGYHILKKVAQWDNGIPMEEIKDQLTQTYNSEKINNELLNNMINSDVWYNTYELTTEIIKTLIEEQGTSENDDL